MKNLKISLVVRGHFPPTESGPAFFYRDIVRVLSGDHDVTVISRTQPSEDAVPENVRVVSFAGPAMIGGILYELRTIHHLIENHYDVIITPFPQVQKFPTYGFLRYLCKIPYILVLHGNAWVASLRPKLMDKGSLHRAAVAINDWAWGEILRGATKVATLDENLIKVVEGYGVPREKIFKIGYVLDTDEFNPEVKPFRLSFPEENVLLFHGRLVEAKGVETLLQAMPAVLSYDDNIHLLVIGDGPLEGKLRTLARALGIDDKVTFVGRILHDQIPSYLATADIVVNPAVWGGGLSSATIESMAIGEPVIMGRINEDVKEVFDRSRCGLAFEPGDSGELSEKIIQLMSDEELRKKLGWAATKYAKNHFSILRNVEIWNKLIKKVVS